MNLYTAAVNETVQIIKQKCTYLYDNTRRTNEEQPILRSMFDVVSTFVLTHNTSLKYNVLIIAIGHPTKIRLYSIFTKIRLIT